VSYVDLLGLWREPIDDPAGCNCHSYALHDCKGDPSSDFDSHYGAPGPFWDNSNRNEIKNLQPIWQIGDQFTPNPQIGDIVDYGNGEHSGKYTGVGEVTSKWGQTPVYRHSPEDVPSFYGPITGIYRK
jgi:hypothetical protein